MLCFNVQGEPDFIFNLISSKYINLNALFARPAVEESRSIDADSTFVSDIGLLVKSKHQKKPVKIKISASDHSVNVLGSHTIVTDSSITVKISKNGDISVSTASKENDVMLYVETEYGFAIKVRFLKKHLDMFITDNSGFINNTHGLLGEYVHNIICTFTSANTILTTYYMYAMKVCIKCKYSCFSINKTGGLVE